MLLSIAPTATVSDVAKNLKGASAHHINQESQLPDTLYWQDGYGVITLRGAEIPKVVEYIQKQKQHHKVGTVSVLLERVQE